VLYSPGCLPQLESICQYLVHHFEHGIDKPNKKVSIRVIRQLWLHMNVIPKPIVDLLLTRKAKQTYQVIACPIDRSKINQLILECLFKNAFVWH
jgi:hypothetical protein